MVRLLSRGVALCAVLSLVGSPVRAEEKKITTVLVPEDEKPFTMGEKELVWLHASGIAGSKIEAKVTGPAKLKEFNLRPLKNGHPLIGNTSRGFDVQPTGKGKVTVELTVTPPTGGDAKVTKYEFEVK
ncbi:MAG: hypothetical protein JWO38_6290 [Gemmataceae bacterium]|nr:hypothetical protein [Gemmataceae bacterium]